ncbi:hypothetical protein B0J13DRAFT_226866 [Dactylonectria estremocensis]|uniref:DUF4440 domain-containing protein n=1 Tax=Dactylonectria estremocensis TaxID=1079267 RepID=A0A9P9F7C1_9HYPO|nr:hypothetical protein B0J13DRAFT_226866 [Dactylonectria estremocensis]
MPSMLGVTTDPSPHGLNSRSSQSGERNGNRQLATRGKEDLVPGLKSDFFTNKGAPKHDDEESDDGEEPPLNTIKGRNHAAAKEMETLLWRALCDKPKSALKYIAKDAIMSNRFLFDDPKVRSKESDPPLEDELKHCNEWLAYKMHDPQVVEIDLMGVALAYRCTLFRQIDKGRGKTSMQTVEATVSSSWRQVASGDWELCSMFAA